MVSRGNCWLSVRGMPDPLPLTGGDCFLLAPASTYALRDNPRTRARSFVEAAPRNGSNVIHYGGGGAPTTIISGWFSFGPDQRQAPETLASGVDTGQGRSSPKPGTPRDFAVARIGNGRTSTGLGSNGQPARGYFVHTVCVRAHIASSSENCKSGWLRAIFDPKIGAALTAMHERVENPWTVENTGRDGGYVSLSLCIEI